MDSSRMNRGCCGANNMQNRRAASNNMELKMEQGISRGKCSM